MSSWAAVISRVAAVERRRSHSRTTSPTAIPANVIAATGGANARKNRPMMTAMATPPERPVRQMVMNSSSWWTVVVSVVVMAERRWSEKYPMGAPFIRSPTRRRRSRNTWKPSASIFMSTRYWNANCPATLKARMPKHCSATPASRRARFSSAHHTAASMPAMKRALRTLHAIPTTRLRREEAEKLPARSSILFIIASI